MVDLRELYQDMIMDHQRYPRNHRVIDDPTGKARGFNPLCGDQLTVYCKITDNTIQDLSFIGCGCAISQASASLMTESLQGKSVEEAHALFEAFHNLLTKEGDHTCLADHKLSVLSGVRTFPARVKCATLAWHTMEAALKNDDSTTVVTE